MDGKNPGEALPSIAPFILKAKYGKDEETCRSAGAMVIESLLGQGRYSVLIDLCRDAGSPPFLAEEARKNILAAAMVACKNSGTNLPLQDVATRQDVPVDIAAHAGVFLAIRLSDPYDEKALCGVLKDTRYPDEARAEAGNAIMSHAEKELTFSTLMDLVASPDVIYEVKKPAGHLLIRLAVERGNYPVLISLSSQKSLPIDLRIALEDKVQMAAITAIELAYAEKDFSILTDISDDARLPASIRGKAMGCLHDSMHEKPASASGAPDPQMTAELMYRLGKGAGAVRSSIEPPPTPAKAPDAAILSRLKR
jgi:hypothetical protein